MQEKTVRQINANWEEWKRRYEAGEIQIPAPGAPVTKPSLMARRSERYASFGDLLDTGQFRSLVFRPGALSGGVWTLKAVLMVQSTPLGVYMHGEVRYHEELDAVIEKCLSEALWREDKYWRP